METVALASSYDKEDMASTKVLHSCTILTRRIITNRLHILFHFTVTLLLLYYRISHFFNGNRLPALSWALITISELIFTFIWCLTQAFRWRPLSRTVSIDEIPANMNLEGLDVFVCTADPQKEPTMEVMNTIISALALDYPPEKLAVYLSDDGGSYITLYALKEAFAFSKRWLPFCMKYRIKTRCPEAFFSLAKYEELSITDEFSAKKDELEVSLLTG
ncbi:cellulose synthase-like protein E1 [Gossypium hirsutum]|uniref:Cellulose synthase-like protein E1 n=1 Tax=Gossypium hirsutum TaxID=3635 RepID=A0ABM2YVE6_GOSHI|nr:cellulose synthase-like protein E1 [Gossypium hirsutum]